MTPPPSRPGDKSVGGDERGRQSVYTRVRPGFNSSPPRVLRRKADPVLGRACKFLDLKTRRCTAREARPQTCREFPKATRCGFYDLLRFEREHSNDETSLPLVKLAFYEK